MPDLTSQQLACYYKTYRETQITFTRQVIRATCLVPDQVQLKCSYEKWPCIIYSTSFVNSRIIVRANTSFFQTLKRANNLVSLRLSFRLPDRADPLVFYILSRATAFTPYNNKENSDLYLITLTFTQKPPDDFIEIIGQFLEEKAGSEKRREERIIITQESERELGLSSSESCVFIESESRKCIIRDLALSGATILLAIFSKLLINKKSALLLVFDGMDIKISGKIIRHEEVVGRQDIAAFALSFDENKVPKEYKKRINNWLSVRARARGKITFEDEKVGDGLIRIGAMTKEQAENVLQRQNKGDNRLFGEIAIELGYVNDDALMKFLVGMSD